jgi:hypothetical protein
MSDEANLLALVQRLRRRVPLSDEDCAAVAALPHVRRRFEREAYIVREGERTAHCHLLIAGFGYRQ